MSIEKNCVKRKHFNSNLSQIMYIDTAVVAKNSVVSCLTSIFDLSILKMKILHSKISFKVAEYDDSVLFFSGRSI